MNIRVNMTAAGLALLAAAGLGGCAVQPIELTVLVRDPGHCAAGSDIVNCRARTAEIRLAYVDPDQLNVTVPELGFTDFDRPGTIEHDRGSTIEHDRGDTIEHDILRCKFRNRQLLEALQRCHQDLNECRANNPADCNTAYMQCYREAVNAKLFPKE